MEKIKIVTDSASDIQLAQAEALGIEILSVMLSVNGESYRELVDLSTDEFYELLEKSDELPTSSQITAFTYNEKFKQYLDEGYTDVICVCINSKGSATYRNACMAKEELYESYPMAAEQMRIHVVDSRSYSALYGYPVRQAAMQAAQGVSADEIVAYLEDWFSKVSVYFVPMTLKYVKKSGRVSAAAAFAGDLLGLRPIIRITDGDTSISEKIRGEKKIVPHLADWAQKMMIPETPYIILHGCSREYSDALGEELTKRLGYPPAEYTKIGAAISINAGPDVAAVIILENR